MLGVFLRPTQSPEDHPASLDFTVLGELPERMHAGLMIRYRVRPLFGIPVRWLTEITHVEPGRYFVDEQRMGPYQVWHHEHWFKALAPDRTEVRDLVHYVLPFGPVGQLVISSSSELSWRGSSTTEKKQFPSSFPTRLSHY
jgi:ligand-binding SRPBCC domain-containing protein